MLHKRRMIVCILLMMLMAWLDSKFLTRRPYCLMIGNTMRWAAHLLMLGSVFVAGVWAMNKESQDWIKLMWFRCYIVVFIVLLVLVWLSHFTHLFHKPQLTTISRFRMFFTGPVPFLILYILSGIGKAEQTSETVQAN